MFLHIIKVACLQKGGLQWKQNKLRNPDLLDGQLDRPEVIIWLDTEFIELGTLLSKQVYYKEVIKG